MPLKGGWYLAALPPAAKFRCSSKASDAYPVMSAKIKLFAQCFRGFAGFFSVIWPPALGTRCICAAYRPTARVVFFCCIRSISSRVSFPWRTMECPAQTPKRRIAKCLRLGWLRILKYCAFNGTS
jgi:hypothetical protein